MFEFKLRVKLLEGFLLYILNYFLKLFISIFLLSLWIETLQFVICINLHYDYVLISKQSWRWDILFQQTVGNQSTIKDLFGTIYDLMSDFPALELGVSDRLWTV